VPVLFAPLVLLLRASNPLAVLLPRVVLPRSASTPVAVLSVPVVLLESALKAYGRVLGVGGAVRQRFKTSGYIATPIFYERLDLIRRSRRC
jgi:hypothetical protein